MIAAVASSSRPRFSSVAARGRRSSAIDAACHAHDLTLGPAPRDPLRWSPSTLPDVPAEPEPPELPSLVDYAERSRVGDWSLRSALMRYAQGNPQRLSDVLDIVRRTEFALHPHSRSLLKEGPTLREALTSGAPPVEPPAPDRKRDEKGSRVTDDG